MTVFKHNAMVICPTLFIESFLSMTLGIEKSACFNTCRVVVLTELAVSGNYIG